MNNLDNSTDSDKEQIKELADNIAQLLSLDIPEIIEFKNLIGEKFLEEQFRWFAIGVNIWTTFSDIPDPIQNSNLDENLKSQIRVDSKYYIALATVVFQAEALIKAEAQRQKIEYPFSNKIELVYALVAEECIDRLRSRIRRNEWETPSGSEFKDMARDSKKWLNNEVSDEFFLKKLSKWIVKDKKNLNSHIFARKPAYLNEIRWNSFCNEIFFKYQKNLPSFLNYTDAMVSRLYCCLPLVQKFAFINGQIHIYPGRGKSKKK